MKTRTQTGFFLNWQENRKLAQRINSHLAAGGAVQVVTYTRATTYTKKNAGQFSAKSNGVFVTRGRKSLDCIGQFIGDRFSGCGIRFNVI